MNCVRKHLSAVKGGRLLPLLPPSGAAALVISDVPGSALTSIGSGPAVPDPTTFGDALAVLRRFDLLDRAPPAVRRRLAEGAAGRIGETPGDGADALPHHILASNPIAVRAAAEAARRLGYRVDLFGHDLTGDAHSTARRFAARLVELGRSGRRRALVGGGELTLRVEGDGTGGRCQEMALVGAFGIEGIPRVAMLAAGTDGTDGPTDAAGGFADGDSLRRGRAGGVDPQEALRRNDSGAFLDAAGDRFATGPTGTNVMDLILGLAGPAP